MPIRSTTPTAAELRGLLPGLSEAAAEHIRAGARAVTYARGETIVGYGSNLVPGLVVDGTVRMMVRAADGREATLRLATRGTMFGLVTLFESAARMASVERSLAAADIATVVLFDRATLQRASGRHADLAFHIAHQLADSASLAADMAGQFAFLSVRQRVARHLLAVAESDATGRPVALATQQELANAIGSVREVVARTLHAMRDEQLIAVTQGRIEILDEQRLSSAVLGT